jgi:hypothetical protein
MNEITAKILCFLQEIGLVYHLEKIEETTLLPGIQLRNGTLIIDIEKLLYPGDILHEAGHLACMPSDIRRTMSGDLEDIDLHRGGEMMAIAWSYAASRYLNINPAIVFHEHGYRNASQSIIDNFNNEYTFGVPLLQWSEMCYDNKNAVLLNTKPFPEMITWMCSINKYETTIFANN